MAMHNLPEDLLPEILSRLPAKSLLRFQSVSKPWRALIVDPGFARLHLTQFDNNRAESRLFSRKGKLESARDCVVRCSKTLRIIENFGYPQSSTGHFPDWIVICSIDGVVLLKYYLEDLLLWNPSIQKARYVPSSREIARGWRCFDTCLVFDESIKDYKCIRFVGKNRTPERSRILQSVLVYTVGSNSWKIVELQGNYIYGWYYNKDLLKSVNLKGVLYLLAWNLNSVQSLCLCSFDLRTELIGSTNIPVEEDDLEPKWMDRALTLADGGCSLAMVTLSDPKVSLWVLESDGESMTWTKRFAFFFVHPYARRHVLVPQTEW